MSPRKSALLVASIAVVCTGQALALDVYLNGVRITGVRDQEFENATVTLDSEGNVRIKAPHYRVERADSTDSGPAGTQTTTIDSGPAKARPPEIAPQRTGQTSSVRAQPEAPPVGGGSGLTHRYWLVAEVNGAGMVQYRIDVSINGRLVRSFTDADAPAPVEVTQYLRQGSNTVRLTAEKLNEGGRLSDSSRHWIRVVVADGHIEGTTVVIDRPGVIFTRNAAQTDRTSRDYPLDAE